MAAEPLSSQLKEKLSISASIFKRQASAASAAMAVAAEKASQKGKTAMDVMKDNWTTKVQPKLAPTLTKMKSGLIATKEKVAASKVGQQVQVTSKQLAGSAKEALSKLDWRQRGVAGSGSRHVFGVPLEVVVQRQGSQKAVPILVTRCVEFLVAKGLQTEYIFVGEGDSEHVTRLIRMFDEDGASVLAEDTDPADVAALLKIYLRTLPDPVLTYELHDYWLESRGRPGRLKELLGTLPSANAATLESVVGLLARVAGNADVNKMDSHSLAIEFAPVFLWPKGAAVTAGGASPARSPPPSEPTSPPKGAPSSPLMAAEPSGLVVSTDGVAAHGNPASGPAEIPLNDGGGVDEGSLVEAVQALIERYEDLLR